MKTTSTFEETLEAQSERFHIENEMRHLRHELHFAEKNMEQMK